MDNLIHPSENGRIAYLAADPSKQINSPKRKITRTSNKPAHVRRLTVPGPTVPLSREGGESHDANVFDRTLEKADLTVNLKKDLEEEASEGTQEDAHLPGNVDHILGPRIVPLKHHAAFDGQKRYGAPNSNTNFVDNIHHKNPVSATINDVDCGGEGHMEHGVHCPDIINDIPVHNL